ncbi:MAG TPA: GDSL-type esterase/lipase family protein, partial [Candidatus Limnocylindrales bacterium]|nr:GDSL-type esterase/lipase family protein [Candidatus Limnocylindrales bacterium]
LWAPRPGALVLTTTGERISRSGFRGPEPVKQREPGVLRLVLLGESSTFGTTVPWEQTCAPKLRALMAAHGVRAEVVNAGVIGHTVCQGVERYRSAVRPLHPDVVVIAYGAQNEHAPCQGRCDREKLALAREEREGRPSPWLALSSHVRVLQLSNWIVMRREAPELSRRMAESRQERSQDPALIGQPDWPGCRRVPLDEFEAALRELCADVSADGARPVLCSLPRTPQTELRLPILPLYSEVIARVGRELGVTVVDLRAAMLSAIAAGAEETSFFMPPDTWHLGPTGQGLLARLLADTLAAERSR